MTVIDTRPEALRALADYWDNAEPAGLDPDNLETVDKVLAESEAKMAATIQVLRALAAEKEASAPFGDGWIKWEGGDCPVASETQVVVRLREGDEDLRMVARIWDWKHYGHSGDIVAYRVVEGA